MRKGTKHSEETKKKISEAQRGKKHRSHKAPTPGFVWYNNGEIETLVRPGTLLEGDNWVQGRLYKLEEATEASLKSENRYRKYDLNSYRWR